MIWIAKIKFSDRQIPWYCLYDEIETERYKKPESKPSVAEASGLATDEDNDDDDEDDNDDDYSYGNAYSDSEDEYTSYGGARYYADDDSDDGNVHAANLMRMMFQAQFMNRLFSWYV